MAPEQLRFGTVITSKADDSEIRVVPWTLRP